MKKILLLLAIAPYTHTMAPGLSISQDSALIPSTISIEEYKSLESQLFTYQQLAALRKKQIERLEKKIPKKRTRRKRTKIRHSSSDVQVRVKVRRSRS